MRMYCEAVKLVGPDKDGRMIKLAPNLFCIWISMCSSSTWDKPLKSEPTEVLGKGKKETERKGEKKENPKP